MTLDDRRWEQLLGPDPTAAGSFVYAVRTTGVYCRPGCRSRRPLRRNVAFFETCAAAERAGYRPCRRCRPGSQQAPEADRLAVVGAACRRIEAASAMPTLAELAGEAGTSPGRFHRLFQGVLGMTPKEYAMAHRSQRLREALTRSPTALRAIHAAGFESGSRGYAESPRALGMTPGQSRRGGPGQVIGFSVAPCSLGFILVAATPRGICAITLGDSAADLEAGLHARFPGAAVAADSALQPVLEKVIASIQGTAPCPELPLDIQGTAFQHRVWKALTSIPRGATATYAEIARAVGSPAATRAVGTACGANPVAVVIPCHRVVRTNGELGGYRWGLGRKQALLERERQAAAVVAEPNEADSIQDSSDARS